MVWVSDICIFDHTYASDMHFSMFISGYLLACCKAGLTPLRISVLQRKTQGAPWSNMFVNTSFDPFMEAFAWTESLPVGRLSSAVSGQLQLMSTEWEAASISRAKACTLAESNVSQVPECFSQ